MLKATWEARRDGRRIRERELGRKNFLNCACVRGSVVIFYRVDFVSRLTWACAADHRQPHRL